MSDNVRRVACVVPMTAEMLGDLAPAQAILRRGMDDVGFNLAVGRGRTTNTAAMTMWRRWPDPLRCWRRTDEGTTP